MHNYLMNMCTFNRELQTESNFDKRIFFFVILSQCSEMVHSILLRELLFPFSVEQAV